MDMECQDLVTCSRFLDLILKSRSLSDIKMLSPLVTIVEIVLEGRDDKGRQACKISKTGQQRQANTSDRKHLSAPDSQLFLVQMNDIKSSKITIWKTKIRLYEPEVTQLPTELKYFVVWVHNPCQLRFLTNRFRPKANLSLRMPARQAVPPQSFCYIQHRRSYTMYDKNQSFQSHNRYTAPGRLRFSRQNIHKHLNSNHRSYHSTPLISVYDTSSIYTTFSLATCRVNFRLLTSDQTEAFKKSNATSIKVIAISPCQLSLPAVSTKRTTNLSMRSAIHITYLSGWMAPLMPSSFWWLTCGSTLGLFPVWVDSVSGCC